MHYLTGVVVTQETVDAYGDAYVIDRMEQHALYPWKFVRKEEPVDSISGHPKVAYVFERWEDE